jgi:hypothetical protein
MLTFLRIANPLLDYHYITSVAEWLKHLLYTRLSHTAMRLFESCAQADLNV